MGHSRLETEDVGARNDRERGQWKNASMCRSSERIALIVHDVFRA